MATLTATELKRLRSMTGDTTQPYDVSDLEMNDEYTNAESDFDTAIVYVLRIRLGKAIKFVDRSTSTAETGGSVANNQRWEHIKQLLEYWEQKTGLSGGGIFAGTMDLGLDEDEVTA